MEQENPRDARVHGILVPLLLAIGGATGGAVRYLLGVAAQSVSVWPVPPSLVINSLGALAVGLTVELALPSTARSSGWRLFFDAGFVGGFTTAAAYTPDTVRLFDAHDYDRAALYAVGSIVLANLAAIGARPMGRSLRARLTSRAG